MTASTSTDDFARALAAFRGERFELDEHGCQALWFAFSPDAADLEITPTEFHVRPAGHHELRYAVAVAPGVLGFLLERFGTVGPRSVRTWIAPTLMRVGRFPAWTSPARHVLAEAWTSRIVVRVRDTETDLDDELPTRPERPRAVIKLPT